MSSLTIAHKTLLEAVLGMRTGFVLDFTDGSFANLFTDLSIDIYDPEKYSGFGTSKANRLRALWKVGSDAEVSTALAALADYIETRQSMGYSCGDITGDQVAKIREIAHGLVGGSRTSALGAPVPVTTEAALTRNRISIEIHEDIYGHVELNLEAGDYFHAVEESYKLVREKLRDLTGEEAASRVFNPAAESRAHFKALFGKDEPESQAEGDFFRGVGYLHLCVQYLRNEKAHTPATPVEPNLALHYISLASLAYDLITRYVSEEAVAEIEELVRAKRKGYRTAGAFYRDFEGGRWLRGIELPPAFASAAVRRALKDKWLDEADFTRSWDYSNTVLMRLELVVDELSEADLDRLLGLPTEDTYGNDQLAGMEQFLEFVEQRHPDRISLAAKT